MQQNKTLHHYALQTLRKWVTYMVHLIKSKLSTPVVPVQGTGVLRATVQACYGTDTGIASAILSDQSRSKIIGETI